MEHAPTPQSRLRTRQPRGQEARARAATLPMQAATPVSLQRCRLRFQSLNYKGRECHGSLHFSHNIGQELRAMQGNYSNYSSGGLAA